MIRRIYRETVYDLKEPGIHILLLPLAGLAFVVMTFFVQRTLLSSGRSNEITLPMLGALLPSLGGYGSLMLMQGLFAKAGGELAFSYPRTRLYWGLIRQLRFFLLYGCWVTVTCFLICLIMRIPLTKTLFLTLSQCFAVMGVAFLACTASKKAAVGLIVMIAFVGIQLVLGPYLVKLNWIYDLGRASILPAGLQPAALEINALAIGCLSWFLGLIYLGPPT